MPSLGELWRSRRWRYLLNLIDHLPSHSHFFQAMSQDEEYAEMVLEAEAAGHAPKSTGPRLTDWTPEVGAIGNLIDKVENLRLTLIGVNGAKPPQFVPYPRPKTAIDRLRMKRQWDQHNALAAVLVPKE